jgi:hypothetical protein
MEMTHHIAEQARKKGIPLPVVEAVIRQQVGIQKSPQDFSKRDRLCRWCGTVKQEWRTYSPITHNGKTYGVKVVVCTKCDEAITVYADERLEGNTPIRRDQWEKGMRQYTAKCHGCGRSFIIRSMDLAQCKRDTTHTCNGKTRHIMKEA